MYFQVREFLSFENSTRPSTSSFVFSFVCVGVNSINGSSFIRGVNKLGSDDDLQVKQRLTSWSNNAFLSSSISDAKNGVDDPCNCIITVLDPADLAEFHSDSPSTVSPDETTVHDDLFPRIDSSTTSRTLFQRIFFFRRWESLSAKTNKQRDRFSSSQLKFISTRVLSSTVDRLSSFLSSELFYFLSELFQSRFASKFLFGNIDSTWKLMFLFH